MTEQSAYLIPSATCRNETAVLNSRFITTIGYVPSTAEAKAFLALVRKEMPDATHHVYAFRIGYGNSVIEGVSDDGEPSGTAGPPVLTVLRGTNIGDIIVIVSRYFGGTKLGTGGLVKAYTRAAQAALKLLSTKQKTQTYRVRIEVPYNLYEVIKLSIAKHNGSIEDTAFGASVTVIASLPVSAFPVFSQWLLEISAGRIQSYLLNNS